MSSIRGKNTKPELIIRKKLYELGFRFRIHYPLVGRPDIVFPSRKVAIFVHGCFWHGHGCKNDHIPKINNKYWVSKIKKNKARDAKVRNYLTKSGWKVLVIWECETTNKTILGNIIRRWKFHLKINGNKFIKIWKQICFLSILR